MAVPGRDTTYWCKVFRFPPEFHRKQHVVQYEAIITPGNEGVVHHMELFHCEVGVHEVLPNWNDDCQSPRKPVILERCKNVISAWAMGAPVITASSLLQRIHVAKTSLFIKARLKIRFPRKFLLMFFISVWTPLRLRSHLRDTLVS